MWIRVVKEEAPKKVITYQDLNLGIYFFFQFKFVLRFKRLYETDMKYKQSISLKIGRFTKQHRTSKVN